MTLRNPQQSLGRDSASPQTFFITSGQLIYEDVKTCIHQAADEALGQRKTMSALAPWWNHVLEKAVKKGVRTND